MVLVELFIELKNAKSEPKKLLLTKHLDEVYFRIPYFDFVGSCWFMLGFLEGTRVLVS